MLLDLVIMTLVSNIPTNDILINANHRDEVSTNPEISSFIKSMLSFNLFLEPTEGLSFHNLHDIMYGSRPSMNELTGPVQYAIYDHDRICKPIIIVRTVRQ